MVISFSPLGQVRNANPLFLQPSEALFVHFPLTPAQLQSLTCRAADLPETLPALLNPAGFAPLRQASLFAKTHMDINRITMPEDKSTGSYMQHMHISSEFIF